MDTAPQARLANSYAHQVFFPRWWSIFTNSFYLPRRGLARGVARLAPRLSGRLLDFGCGSKPYEAVFDVEQYVGVDIQESGHDHSTSRVDAYYDGQVLPFLDECFDCVLASEVFEHVPDMGAVLAELHRVTAPDGLLLLTMPFAWDQHEEPFDFRRLTQWGLREELTRHGWEMVVECKTSGYLATLAALWSAYIYKHTPNRYLRRLLRLLFVAPLVLISLAVERILPDNGNLYLGHIALARRV